VLNQDYLRIVSFFYTYEMISLHTVKNHKFYIKIRMKKFVMTTTFGALHKFRKK